MEHSSAGPANLILDLEFSTQQIDLIDGHLDRNTGIVIPLQNMSGRTRFVKRKEKTKIYKRSGSTNLSKGVGATTVFVGL